MAVFLWYLLILVVVYVIYSLFVMFWREVTQLLYYKFIKGYKIYYYFPFFGGIRFGFKDKRAQGNLMYMFENAIHEQPAKKYHISNFLGYPLITIYDDQMISDYFERNLENYVKMPMSNLKRIFGTGLLFAEGAEWKKQRKVLSEAFHFDSLKKMSPIILQTIKENFAELKAQKDLNNVRIMDEFQKITGDIVCRTFFGQDFAKHTVNGRPLSLELSEFIQVVSLQALAPHSQILGKWILKLGLTKHDRDVINTREAFRTFGRRTINERRQNPQKVFGEDTARKDFLQVIFEHNEKNPSEAWSDDLILDQFMTFFIAGEDTTGHLLGIAAYYLTKYPETKKKILEEYGTLNKPVEQVSTDDLASLKYLDAFWQEALRLGTPASQLFNRVAIKDHKLGEIEILKGTLVNVAISSSCRNEKNWDQPFEFRPERWLEAANTSKKRGAYQYIPFSGGPHNCIGKYMAAIEAKFTILFFVHWFNFELSDPEYQLQWVLKFMYEPKNPVTLNLKIK